MPYYCTVPRCTSMAGKAKNVSFHQFPRDEELAKLWNKILKRGKPYTKYSKVCSLHFRPEDYTITSVGKNKGQWRTLRKDAIPSQNLPSESPVSTPRRNSGAWLPTNVPAVDPRTQQQMAQAIYLQTMLAMQAANGSQLPPQMDTESPTNVQTPSISYLEQLLQRNIPDHTKNSHMSFKCNECSKCFKDPDVFVLHKRTHNKIETRNEKENLNTDDFSSQETLRANPILANLLNAVPNSNLLIPDMAVANIVDANNILSMENQIMTALAANMESYIRNLSSLVSTQSENSGDNDEQNSGQEYHSDMEQDNFEQEKSDSDQETNNYEQEKDSSDQVTNNYDQEKDNSDQVTNNYNQEKDNSDQVINNYDQEKKYSDQETNNDEEKNNYTDQEMQNYDLDKNNSVEETNNSKLEIDLEQKKVNYDAEKHDSKETSDEAMEEDYKKVENGLDQVQNDELEKNNHNSDPASHKQGNYNSIEVLNEVQGNSYDHIQNKSDHEICASKMDEHKSEQQTVISEMISETQSNYVNHNHNQELHNSQQESDNYDQDKDSSDNHINQDDLSNDKNSNQSEQISFRNNENSISNGHNFHKNIQDKKNDESETNYSESVGDIQNHNNYDKNYHMHNKQNYDSEVHGSQGESDSFNEQDGSNIGESSQDISDV